MPISYTLKMGKMVNAMYILTQLKVMSTSCSEAKKPNPEAIHVREQLPDTPPGPLLTDRTEGVTGGPQRTQRPDATASETRRTGQRQT